VLNLVLVSHSYAASWTTLQDNKHAKLKLDKQSIAESGKYQKAWVKIIYKSLQTNLEYPEKSYNNAKLLWYFNCPEKKSATAQVYQLLNDEQVYSAAIDVKRARFLEPVPETEIDIAMHYVCKRKANLENAKAKIDAAKKAHENEQATTSESTTQPAAQKVEKVAEKPVTAKEVSSSDETEAEATDQKDKAKDSQNDSKVSKNKHKKEAKPKKHKKVHWKYKGSRGPEHWGDLSPDFISCKVGRNQSPIDINKTIVTPPKPLKTFQRFPALDILHNGHTVQANFKTGNIMVVDKVMYQMKQVHFHAPSENMIMGQSFPLEAHFVHVDPKGNLAVLAVMFEEGAENKALAKLWKQMPERKTRKSKQLKSKVLASQLIPRKKNYYRFSGSLTTPPCSEGVIWIVMKSTMTASKSQIDAFKKVMRHDNNRPVQPLNGRIVIE
jgi:carbonic anhydrase